MKMKIKFNFSKQSVYLLKNNNKSYFFNEFRNLNKSNNAVILYKQSTRT